MGQGCTLISAREFQEEIKAIKETAYREYSQNQNKRKNYLGESISEEIAKQIKE